MAKIQRGTYTEPANSKGMEDDKVVFQRFTCCEKVLEKFLWEGWDWTDGNIIAEEILKDFKFCPFCGKELKEVENNG